MSRFQFVADHCDAFEVKWLCAIVEVARSSFYAWLAGADGRAARTAADQALRARIRAVHAGDNTYGAPRITAELNDGVLEGDRVNHKRVARVMRTAGIADNMRTELVADALHAADALRGTLSGVVFHADHGSRYTSKDFAQLCDDLGVTQSMGGVGSNADNALAESFNATLKREILQDRSSWPDAATCRREVFRWLVRCNTTRRHSHCRYVSLISYERTLTPATLPQAA